MISRLILSRKVKMDQIGPPDIYLSLAPNYLPRLKTHFVSVCPICRGSIYQAGSKLISANTFAAGLFSSQTQSQSAQMHLLRDCSPVRFKVSHHKYICCRTIYRSDSMSISTNVFAAGLFTGQTQSQ